MDLNNFFAGKNRIQGSKIVVAVFFSILLLIMSVLTVPQISLVRTNGVAYATTNFNSMVEMTICYSMSGLIFMVAIHSIVSGRDQLRMHLISFGKGL